ncbi:hypothetical protein LPJ55_005732 [Coemansia sp. RSA 990]|nr:hypothetical protein LPJ55_005732 [Coemansia sp. RSA 990]
MIRRKEIVEEILPPIPNKVRAFAYRPYPSSFITQQKQIEDDSDDDTGVQIIERRVVPSAKKDRQQMAKLHASAAYARIQEARRLVDDNHYEYACDVIYECQRGRLHPMDPPAWCDTTMKLAVANVHSFQVPDPSWQWVSPRWLIDMTLDVDEDGWQYSSRFSNSSWHSRFSAAKSFVRRRRWLRLRRRRHQRQDQSLAESAENGNECVDIEAEQGTLAGSPSAVLFQKPKQQKSRHPADMAAKIKDKVSRNYVGKNPRNGKRELAFTLKDGKYRSHRPLRKDESPGALQLRRTKSVVLADIEDNDTELSDEGSPTSLHMLLRNKGTEMQETRKRHDSGNGIEQASVPQIAVTSEPARDSTSALLRQVQRSLSTVWNQNHLPLSFGQPAAYGNDSHEQLPSPTSDGTSPQDAPSESLPRLVGRMAPEPTVPREDTGLGSCMPADSQDLEAVMAAACRPRSSRHRPWSLKPVASAFLSSLHTGSRRNSAVDLPETHFVHGVQSVPVSPHNNVQQHVEMPPNSPINLADSIASSTAIDSHLSLVIRGNSRNAADGSEQQQQQQQQQSRRPFSLASSSTTSLDDFSANMLPLLDPYVDPYTSLHIPRTQSGQATLHTNSAAEANFVADKHLIELASSTLRSLMSDIMLDRERLEFIHECLRLGGITAATIWYSLPWLHFDLLHFDNARQRFIALLLAHSQTCPPDALRYFSSLSVANPKQLEFDEKVAMQGMGERECKEYMQLMADLDRGAVIRPLMPAQAWRLVIKPVVSRDPDLFYSDFKLMVMGVARWDLAVKC